MGADLSLPLKSQIGAYSVQRVLGQGGYAITYAARAKNGELVAIKELFPEQFSRRSPDNWVSPKPGDQEDFEYIKERFVREARMVCGFNHPNLLKGLDWFEQNGTAYIVMRYESGLPLHQHLRNKSSNFKVTPGSIARLFQGLLVALKVAHDQHCVHCDIKPGNIYLGENFLPVLLDFGAARHAVNERLYQAHESLVPFTEYYAPIEQYPEHSGEIGPWTDIYQLAAVIYRCLTGGKIPSAIDRVVKGAPDPYYPLSQLVIKGKGYPVEFLEAVDWALAIQPRDRPQSISEWRRRLDRPMKRMAREAKKTVRIDARDRPIVETVENTELPPETLETLTVVSKGAKSGYERRKTQNVPDDYDIDQSLGKRSSDGRTPVAFRVIIWCLVLAIVVLIFLMVAENFGWNLRFLADYWDEIRDSAN
tara:strand:- start:15798 stop:17060 length:1263 start_codon:yes stop_codon:yes gene_type:complete